jgi:LacI family transcriptional regulator
MPEGKALSVTMAVIAAKAGVSKNTVSLALRQDSRIRPSTRVRIERIARKLGYTKNPVLAHLMAELRRAHSPDYRRTMALLNGHRMLDALTQHPTVSIWAEGCRRRGAQQGYRFDEFWLHDPELDGKRLARILRTRGISGAILLGSFANNQLSERFTEIWETFPCVVTGIRTHNPTLSFCCVDHHELMCEAMEHLLTLGYKRPALVLAKRVNDLVDGRFYAGMWTGQQALPLNQRIPSFGERVDAPGAFNHFAVWMKRYRPDALLTLNPLEVGAWVKQLKLDVPRDIGLVDLERKRSNSGWAAMDQRNDLSGEAAVDMMVTMLHNNESGVLAFPRATLCSGFWVPGSTVRDQR